MHFQIFTFYVKLLSFSDVDSRTFFQFSVERIYFLTFYTHYLYYSKSHTDKKKQLNNYK